MNSIIPIIANIVVSPFFLFCLGLLAAWAMLLYGFWQGRQGHKRIQALVDRIRALHAQAGTRPRPRWLAATIFFPKASTGFSGSTGNLTP